MAFSYNGPGVTAKDTVRFLIGDTDAEEVLLQDNEITWTLGQYNNAPMNAAIRCCEAIISKFSRLADEKLGPLSVAYSQKAKGFRLLLVELRNRLATEDTDWYAGGVTRTDMIQNECKGLVRPSFRSHMMENQLISPWIAGPVNEYPGWWW